jgi:cytochrome c peroxidase
MNTSSGKASHQIQVSRRSTTTIRVTAWTVTFCCLTLIAFGVVASRGNSASRNSERLHKRSRFFNPGAVPHGINVDPCVLGVNVDQVVSLKEVPVPVPCAIVWNPKKQGPIPGPEIALNFQPLSAEIVKDQTALLRLGKALFWDMQVGSDGIQSCATCHFSAGADIRTRNQISPNLSDANFKHNAVGPPPSGSGLGGDALFGNSTVPFTANDPNAPNPMEPPDPNLNRPGHPPFAPNYKVVAGDFPLNDWFSPTELTPRGPGVTLFEEMSNVSRDTNDILASQGMRLAKFAGINPGSAVDLRVPTPDFFNIGGTNIRRPMPRNSPTMINAGFNFDNLWEGRGSFVFNGVNGFGFRDRTNMLQENIGGHLTKVFIRVTNSSLASVAVGPPLSNIAMSFSGRTMPDVGLKMTNLRPLAKQLVHPHDSVLGPLSRASLSSTGATGGRGLNVHSYCEMIQAAFQDQWWNHPDVLAAAAQRRARSAAMNVEESHSSSESLPKFTVHKARVAAPSLGAAGTTCQGSTPQPLGPGTYTQMQANFSLFFGLAVQAYMATLVSDNTPFDQFNGAPNPVRQADGSPCPPAGCPPIPPNPNALTATQSLGLTVFMDDNNNLGTHCADCHVPPVTTGHTVLDYQPDAQGVPSLAQGEAIEFMIMGDNLEEANYDHGMYNIGLRRSGCGTATCGAEDKGRGANAAGNPPFQNPLFFTKVHIKSISRTSNLVTVTTTTSLPSFFNPGLFIKIAGVGNPSFDSKFLNAGVAIGPQPLGIKLSPTQFTYKVPGPLLPDATSSGGTAGAGKPFPLSLVELTALREDTVTCAAATIPHVGCLPPDVARFLPDVPILPRRVTNGAFKAPNLRNIKFSGPYFHVGDSATLRQVVEFYIRGGNFPNTNLHDKTVDVDGIPPLMFPEFNPAAEQSIDALVDFLSEGLTDNRVALEQGPFDHPSLIVPNGSPAAHPDKDIFMIVPAVGTEGRAAPLPTFLNLDPHTP